MTAITTNPGPYFNYWIVAAAVYTFGKPQVMVVIGQHIFDTLEEAKQAQFNEDVLNFSELTTEAVVLYRVTYLRTVAAPKTSFNVRLVGFEPVTANLVLTQTGNIITASNVLTNSDNFDNILTTTDTNV